MGGDTSYHYSKLQCSAPETLPGEQVNVLLSDMGMTQMMGGTAPLSAHMRLQSTPTSVKTGAISFIAKNVGIGRAHV